ncbi:hypothetical protein ACFU5Y_04110 [Streptomyces gardneri]|uniref:hypothetical protein n=1 Tax=Streptomyces gardneri TaxID=66892 RepID=UPI0036B8A88E
MSATENDRLKAALHDAAAQIASLESDLGGAEARIAELEVAAKKVAGFCAQRAEYVDNLHNCAPSNDRDYYRWTGHAEARRQLSQLVGLPVDWPAESDMKCSACGNVKVKLNRRLLCPKCIKNDLSSSVPPQRSES